MIRDRSPLKRESQSDSESEDIFSFFNTLINLNTMTQPSLSYSDIQVRFNFAKNMVPEYSGGSKDLCFFIKNAEKFINNFTFSDTLLNEYFFNYVISQIKGEARDLVILNNPTDFKTLKELLLSKYKDPRSEQLLLTSLTTCYQLHNQSFEYYSNEIKLRLQKLKENVQLNTADINTINIKNQMFDEQARCTFIAGLKEPHHSYILHLNPPSLDDCINQCRVYDNLQQHNNYLNFMRNNSHKSTNYKKPQQNFNHLNKNNNHSFGNQQNSQFPRGPIQMPAPRFVRNNFPTNRQVFGRQTNVFKPRNDNANFPKPTPMSTTTRNTNFQGNQMQNQNRPYHFQNNRNNIIVEELYNVEQNTESPENFRELAPQENTT